MYQNFIIIEYAVYSEEFAKYVTVQESHLRPINLISFAAKDINSNNRQSHWSRVAKDFIDEKNQLYHLKL